MKPRIVFFLSKLATGGAERQTVLLAKQLIKLGYPCSLLTYYGGHSQLILDDEIRSSVESINGGSMRNVFEWSRAWSRLAALKPDIIVAVNPSVLPIVVAGRACGRYNAAITCVFHTTIPTTMKMRLTFPMARLALRFTDRLIYVCNAQREFWEERGLRARAVNVIHNGIDVARYSAESVEASKDEAKAGLGFASSDYVVGLTAAFRPEKNHPQAVDAVMTLRARRIPAKLLLVGDGPEQQQVEKYVEKVNACEAVLFAGGQKDVRPFVKAMDVGILCSIRGETFSMAALETMAMSVPMVMPRMSGCVELVENGQGGRLFEVGDTPGLVAQLEYLYEARERAKAADDARGVVRERFTEDGMVAKYAALFDQMSARAL
jgi:glycosyltransferase involved in cell wall biosynthesis